ncbi:unnamed protein product [Pieris macdunnoughi]|uniref:Uncharacterized protein n=1 Tax=Pieris macdunnoughi TaxID=345717 RepID=A0A821VEJ0_9NEOP|nr:unnamed protein product [Pieris macdunnoughi]
MQKVTLAYNDEEIYEVEDCRNLDFQICKGNLIKINTCESEILNKKESDKCQAVPIKCPVQEVFQISPKAIYMFFNKTTEVSANCNNHQETLWTKGSNILYGENCELNISGIKMFKTTESKDKMIIANIDIPMIKTASEIDIVYDATKIKSKLKQLKTIDSFSEHRQHEIIQYSWISIITIIIVIIILVKILRSKVWKPRTSNLEGESEATQVTRVLFKRNNNDLVIENPDTSHKDKQPRAMTPWNETISH